VLPESFTDPHRAYHAAKRRGMDFVTLTDHNTIRGALEIAHHPDAFVSVEATALFPEDLTPVHVLCWGITEAQFADIDRLRPNLYELVDHLCREGIAHALAHPLQRVGGDLTPWHVERCLLLFGVWEGRNGARTRAGNEMAVRIAGSASPAYLAKLAERHDMAPRGDGPPALTGGSDDHGLLDVAATWTATPPARTVPALLELIREGRTAPGGAHGSTQALAHAMVALAVKANAELGECGVPAGLRHIVGDLVAHPLPGPPPAGEADRVGREVMARLRADRRMVRRWRRLGSAPDDAARAHARLRLVTGWAEEQLLGLATGPSGGLVRAGLGGLADRLGWLLGSAAMVAPYLAAAGYHASEARFAAQVGAEFFGQPMPEEGPVRVAMLTDTYDELNGVAVTMRRLAARSARTGAGITVVAPGDRPLDSPGLVRLRPLAWTGVPAYSDPGFRLGVPPLLDLVDLVEARRIEVLHAATPGPMGAAALLLARVMGLPFVATYPTELARYAMALTGDRLAAELVRAATGWLYRQADQVYVPSRATATGLIEEGVDPARIVLFSRGVDPVLFHPRRRSRLMRRRLGGGDGTVVLSVGRLSHEKGLLRLAEAHRRLTAAGAGVTLALVGDGPARADLERALAGTPHRFLGPLTGEKLAEAYASADCFCLPSETETLGQVVLEAQTSGLPAVVVAATAAAESVEDGVTGVHAPSSDPAALAAAIGGLTADPARAAAMGARAREAMLARPGWDEIIDGLAASYAGLRGPRAPRPRPALEWEPAR
jgi:glycosyltransferase involved in cell wall biosynthesis